MTTRRANSLIIVFLLISAVIASLASFWTPNVQAGNGSMSIGPSHAPPGYGRASASSVVTLSGGGFTPGSRDCTIFATGGSGQLFDTNPNRTTCHISDSGSLSGGFSVLSTAVPGGYTINLVDYPSGWTFSSRLTVGFTVNNSPALTFSVNSGSPGTTVVVTASGFAGGLSSNPDTGACSIVSTPVSITGTPDIIGTPSCFIDASGNLYQTQFTVTGGAKAGGYVINVTGSHGDFGLRGFTVTAFNVTLNPTRGQPGQVVFVGATGAPPNTGCSLQSNTPNLITAVSGLGGTSNGVITGSFTVGTNPPAAGQAGGGANNVTLICGKSTSSAGFTVLPKMFISSFSGSSLQTVGISGYGFRGDMTLCSITSNSTVTSDNVVTQSSCTVSGTGTLFGQFIVSSSAPNGPYNITVTPNVGFGAATQFFKVTGPFVFVSPNVTTPGFGTLDGQVIVSGSGFPTGSSRSCILSSNSSAIFFATSPAPTCSISITGTVSGSFAVAPAATANAWRIFRINVTDTVSGGLRPVSASQTFNVTRAPAIEFNPTSAGIGMTVQVSNTMPSNTLNGFSPFDAGPCQSFTSSPSGLFQISACSISLTGNLTASFIVASSNPATYTITVRGIHGDSASNVFSPAGGPTASLSPSVVTPSGGIPTFVAVTGSGFNTLDTTCTIKVDVTVADSTSLSCAISNGAVTGSFRVLSTAVPGAYQVNVTGNPNSDVGYAILQVAVTAVSTSTSTSTSQTTTTTSTSITSTITSTSLSTTTMQTTGISTQTWTVYTTTTQSGQSTATSVSTSTTTSPITMATQTSTTTLASTVTHTFGMVVGALNSTPAMNAFGLFSLLILLMPIVVRRLFA